MPDPIWIDTNFAIKASSGNKAYEAELIRLRRAGHHLLMPPAAHHEFMYGNPITEGKGKNPAPVWTERPPPGTARGEAAVALEYEDLCRSGAR